MSKVVRAANIYPQRTGSETLRRPWRAMFVLLLAAAFAGAGCGGDEELETDVFSVNVPFSLNSNDVVFTDFVANIRYEVPQITQNVASNGAVLAFIRDLEGTWTALPFSYGLEAVDQPVVDYTVSIGYAFELRTLDVFVEASSSDDVVWNEILADPLLGTSRQIRIVIIDSYIAGKNGIDLRDYEAVRTYYNLPE